MVANWPLILGITASFIAVGNILFTYFRTRVKGPKFVIVDTKIDNYELITLNRKEDLIEPSFSCRLIFRVINIGDRIGILNLNSNKLLIDNYEKPFIDPEQEWENPIAADVVTVHTYNYFIPEKHQYWSKGTLIIKGYYYDQDGLYNSYEAEFKGKNEKLTIWKLQMNRWKKFWMQIRYRSRLKQIVE